MRRRDPRSAGLRRLLASERRSLCPAQVECGCRRVARADRSCACRFGRGTATPSMSRTRSHPSTVLSAEWSTKRRAPIPSTTPRSRAALPRCFSISSSATRRVSWDYNEFTYGIRALFTDSYRLTTFGLLLGFALWWALLAYGVLTGESRRKWLIVAGGVLVTALAYIAILHSEPSVCLWGTGARLAVVHPLRACRRTAVVRALVLPAAAGIPGRWVAIALGSYVDGQCRRRAAIYVAALLAFYAVETPYLRPILEPNPEFRMRAEFEPRARANSHECRDFADSGSTSRATCRTGFVGRMLLVPARTDARRRSSAPSTSWRATTASLSRRLGAGSDYVWIPSELTPEAATGLARFSADGRAQAFTAFTPRPRHHYPRGSRRARPGVLSAPPGASTQPSADRDLGHV